MGCEHFEIVVKDIFQQRGERLTLQRTTMQARWVLAIDVLIAKPYHSEAMR